MSSARADLLELARTAAGFTQGDLAAALGVTQAYISQLERGQRVLTEEIVTTSAAVTGVPPEFFSVNVRPLGEGQTEILHRKRLTLPMKPQKRAHALANRVRIELAGLFDEVEVETPIEIPRFQPGASPEEAAAKTRTHWRSGRGPLPNLIAHIEAAGVPVLLTDLFHPKLSALTLPGLNTDWVILLNDRLPADHCRWSLAHELGHVVLRHHRPAIRHDPGWAYPDDAWEDDEYIEEIEGEANRFAAELLLPEADIKPELRDVKPHQLGPLKQRWRVAIAALIRRAGDLGAIGKDAQRALYIRLSQLPGGRHNEPGAFEHEQPTLVKSMIQALLSEDLTLHDVAAVMCCTEEVLRERYLGERQRLRSVALPNRRRPVTRLNHP